MLGEKRNLSLFGSQPAQEEKQVKHITVDRDGEKKDIPLYFGQDGMSAGCTFRMRRGYASMTLGPSTDRKPASTTRSMLWSFNVFSRAASKSSLLA